MGKTAAVIGAGGFIGSRLVTGLAKLGWKVYAVTSQPQNVAQSLNIKVISSAWTQRGVESAFAQARDAGLWVMTGARVDFSGRNILGLYRDNALLSEGWARLIAGLAPKPRIIYLSSISVYGPRQELGVKVSPEPESHYGLSKLLGERLCLAYLGNHCLVLRLSGVWGRERNPKLFVNRCLQQAGEGRALAVNGPGAAKRNYLWVGDMARIADRAYERRWHGLRLVGGPQPISMREMVTAIADRFGVTVNFTDAETPQLEMDVLVKIPPELPLTDFYEALDIEIGDMN